MKPNATPSAPFDRIVASQAFHRLELAKRGFIVPATLFFLAYYFTLPILTGFWPELMGRKILGHFSLAYLFALSQFPMTWILAGLYLRAAARFDRQAEEILAEAGVADQKGAAG